MSKCFLGNGFWMSRKRGKLGLTLSLLALVAFFLLNIWFVTARRTLIIGRLADYATVYSCSDAPHIRTVVLKDGILHLDIGGSCDDESFCEGLSSREKRGSGGWIHFPVQEGRHVYRVTAHDDKTEIRLDATYHTSKAYMAAGKVEGDRVHIYECSVPIGQRVLYSISDWTGGYEEEINPQERTRALAMLDAYGFDMGQSARSKVQNLVSFLMDHVCESFGTPSDNGAEALNGLSVFFSVLDSGNKVWCSNLASMYCAFANLVGLPSRQVTVVGAEKNVGFTGHTFAETYIREEQSWAMVDLTAHRALVVDPSDHVVNSSQLLNSLQVLQDLPFTAYVYESGGIVARPYSAHNHLDKNYFGPNSSLLFFKQASSSAFLRRAWTYLAYPKLLLSSNPTRIVRLYRIWRSAQIGLLFSIVAVVWFSARHRRFRHVDGER